MGNYTKLDKAEKELSDLKNSWVKIIDANTELVDKNKELVYENKKLTYMISSLREYLMYQMEELNKKDYSDVGGYMFAIYNYIYNYMKELEDKYE